MKQKILITLFFLIGFCFAQSQFVRVISTENKCFGYSVIQTRDGEYTIAGRYGEDIFFTEFDSKGTSKLSRVEKMGYYYEGGCHSLLQTIDDGFIVVGRGLVKFNPSGGVEWTRILRKADGYSIIQTNDGGLAVTGKVSSLFATRGFSDLFIVKFDSIGSIEWARAIDGGGFGNCSRDDDYGYSIAQTFDDGYAVVGKIGCGNLFLIKLDSVGKFVWSRIIENSIGRSIIQDRDSGLVIAGWTGSHDPDGGLLIIKFNPNGKFKWARAVGGIKADSGYCVIKTIDDGFAVIGNTKSYGSGENDLFLVKFDSLGSLKWARAIGGKRNDYGRSIVQTSDGGFAVTGFTHSYREHYIPANDLIFIKLDSIGNSVIGKNVSPNITKVSPSIWVPQPTVTNLTQKIIARNVEPKVTAINPSILEIYRDMQKKQ